LTNSFDRLCLTPWARHPLHTVAAPFLVAVTFHLLHPRPPPLTPAWPRLAPSLPSEQEHIKEQIAGIGENIQVRRFARYNLGEGIEK